MRIGTAPTGVLGRLDKRWSLQPPRTTQRCSWGRFLSAIERQCLPLMGLLLSLPELRHFGYLDVAAEVVVQEQKALMGAKGAEGPNVLIELRYQ